jgi:excisionase family DNA binding protein
MKSHPSSRKPSLSTELLPTLSSPFAGGKQIKHINFHGTIHPGVGDLINKARHYRHADGTVLNTNVPGNQNAMEHIQKILGLSRLKAYELPHQQGFPVVRFGRAIRVPRDAFLKWLETQAGGDL